MKFTAAIFTVALAAITVSATPQPATTSLSATAQSKCLAQCPNNAQYANCAAQCLGVPHPSSADTEATRKCEANCDQGDGSPAQTEKYSQCLLKCSNEHYFSSTLVANPTQIAATSSGMSSMSMAMSSGAASSMATGKSSSVTSKSGSSPASSTTGGSAPKDTGNAAARIGAPIAGIAGLAVAIFAL